MAYLWLKTLHIVFVTAWMAAVFYLPRILVNIAEAQSSHSGEAAAAVRARLILMGRRLYRFGHVMFGIAFVFGLTMWQGWRIFPALQAAPAGGWLHAKLALVVALLGYYSWTGRLLKGLDKGRMLPSPRSLRWLNELPVLVLVIVVWLVVAKPF